MKIKKIKILALSFGITPMIIAPIMTQVISKTNNYTNSNIKTNKIKEAKSFFWSEGQRSGDRNYHIYINSSDFNVLKNDLRNDKVKVPDSYGWSLMSFITTKWNGSSLLLQILKGMNDYYSFNSVFNNSQSHVITGQDFPIMAFAQLAMETQNNRSLYINMNVDWELFADNYGATYFFGTI